MSTPESSQSTGRNRQQIKKETRQALIAAARAAFEEQGLAGPSLDAICAKAGFTRGAFYVHFKSRDDLVAAVMEDVLREIVNAALNASDGGGLDGSIGRFVAAIRNMRGAPHFHQLLEVCGRSPQVSGQFNEILGEAGTRLTGAIERAQDRGEANAKTDPEALASLLLLGALGIVVAEQVQLPYDFEAARKALLDLLVP